MNHSLNIVVLTGHQYPVGTAQTNRVRSYLEALAALKQDVQVIIYRPSEEKSNRLNNGSGLCNGVRYTSSALSIYKINNRFIGRIPWIYSYLNCIYLLWSSHRKKKIDIIIQASSKSSIIPMSYAFCKVFGVKYMLENSEYPWFMIRKNIWTIGYSLLYLKVYYKLFDGFIAMTNALVEFHRRNSRRSSVIFLLPMTVEMQRFNLQIPRENKITYIGDASYYKDGLEILLNAFISISDVFPDWSLMIVGNTSKDGLILKIINDLGKGDRVFLTGPIHRDKVPDLLCASKILALARPDNLQSKGGFPTKLGEYLATGNLVVVTDVGEITTYLNDNISALIAKPGDTESFAAKLAYAIINYEQLQSVRMEGYNVCNRVFNANVQGLKLLSRLEDIAKKN